MARIRIPEANWSRKLSKVRFWTWRIVARLRRSLRRLRCNHQRTRTITCGAYYHVEWCVDCGQMLYALEEGKRLY